MGKTFKYYDIILAVFAAILLISNLAGTKLIAFGSAVLYDRALYATGAGVCGSGCI